MSGGGDMVICSMHHARRKAVYCEKVAVYNADKKIVDYVYQCSPQNQCTPSSSSGAAARSTAESSAEPRMVDCSSSVMKSSSSGGSSEASRRNEVPQISFITSTAVDPESLASKAAAGDNEGAADSHALPTPKPANSHRYYEPKRGGSSSTPIKVCWNCGLPGHEKPECTNSLCLSCHSKKPSSHSQPHHCNPVTPSPFIILKELPQEAMKEVCCYRCGESGHFDCGNISKRCSSSELSCCFCAERGHTGYHCHFRDSQRPDRWVMNMMRNSGGGFRGSDDHSQQQNFRYNRDSRNDGGHHYSGSHSSSPSHGDQRYSNHSSQNSYNNNYSNNRRMGGGGGYNRSHGEYDNRGGSGYRGGNNDNSFRSQGKRSRWD